MRAAAAVVVGMVIGAVGALTAQKLMTEGTPAPSPPSPTPQASLAPSPLPSPMCDALVKISLDASGKPTATPDIVCLAKGRELTWEIDPRLEAGAVEVDFKLQGPDKGPFTEVTTNPHYNNGRGMYKRMKADNRPIRSNAAEKLGRWRYSVIYTPDGGQPSTLDPAVCVRD
jgi:hypothetical protein